MEAARISETMVNFYQTTRRYNSEDSHLNTFMGPSMSVCRVFHYIVTTMTLNTIVAAVTLDNTVAFVDPLVALLTLSSVMWRKERLWNFSVRQRVRIQACFIMVHTRYVKLAALFDILCRPTRFSYYTRCAV
jgi:hypothetical protein